MSTLFSILPRFFEHTDARGSISGLINVGNWREMNLISSDIGAVRGRHYHKSTLECFVILSGRVHVTFRRPVGGDIGDCTWEHASRDFIAGDVFIVKPMVEHTFHIQETAQWINLLSQPVDPQKPDFYRYENHE
ncbi:cupin domain-containing protein [Haematospirillum sp. H1815]|uniref:cupin domain-containing protein n=1 Tax=Haematospirillum sp. H1815 TaxID=2723108 RepID=UPI00143C871B|nr:cupin domain-containing protein [Haematospirillum sp. H1815]NKD76841.1 cupin domain-containing protein [Haematospirillum sp. H1815]